MTLQTRDPRHADLDALLSRRARQVGTEPLLQGMDHVGQRISFSFGFPDPASLPADEVAAVTTRVLGERGRAALQYGDYVGYSGLIDALIAKLSRDQGFRRVAKTCSSRPEGRRRSTCSSTRSSTGGHDH